jgi:hypothetical protein
MEELVLHVDHEKCGVGRGHLGGVGHANENISNNHMGQAQPLAA